MEVLGTGNRHMRVQYCGGWGYRPQVVKAWDRLGENNQHFTWHLLKDQGTTGNFEVLEFDNAECSGDGTAIFSKQEKKKFPHSDDDTWNEFVASLKIWAM